MREERETGRKKADKPAPPPRQHLKTSVTRHGKVMVAKLTQSHEGDWHGITGDGAQAGGHSAEECRDNLGA